MARNAVSRDIYSNAYMPTSMFEDLAMEIHSMPKTTAIPVFRMFCSVLELTSSLYVGKPSYPSINTVEQDPDTEDYAYWALMAISDLAYKNEWHEVYTDVLIGRWRGVFKWMRHFYFIHLIGGDINGTGVESYVLILHGMLFTTFRDRSRRLALKFANTPGMINMVTYLWLTGHDDESRSTFILKITVILSQMLDDSDRSDALDEVLEASHGEAADIMRFGIYRLQSSLRPGFVQTNDARITVDVFLGLLYQICQLRPKIEEGTHPIALKWLSESVLLSVTEALTIIAALPKPLSPTPIFDHNLALKASFMCLRNAFDFYGAPAVVQSLQGGLLKAYVLCAEQFKDLSHDGLTHAKDIMEEILPRYLLFTTVVRATKPWIALLRGPKIEAKFDHSLLKKQWFAFRLFALERIYIWAANKVESNRHCDNCTEPSRAMFLRRCAECRMVWYCSRNCQKAQWKTHRKYCGKMVLSRERNLYKPLTVEDETFLMAVFKRDTQRFRSALRRKAAKFYPNLKIQQMGLLVDYCSVPPKFDVFDLRDFDLVYAGSANRGRLFVRNDSPESSQRMIENLRLIGRAPVIAVIPRGIYIENKILYASMARWEVEYEYFNSLIRVFEERTGRCDQELDGDAVYAQEAAGIPVPFTQEENDRKSMRRLLDGLVAEELRLRNDVEGSWLTQRCSKAVNLDDAIRVVG